MEGREAKHFSNALPFLLAPIEEEEGIEENISFRTPNGMRFSILLQDFVKNASYHFIFLNQIKRLSFFFFRLFHYRINKKEKRDREKMTWRL